MWLNIVLIVNNPMFYVQKLYLFWFCGFCVCFVFSPSFRFVLVSLVICVCNYRSICGVRVCTMHQINYLTQKCINIYDLFFYLYNSELFGKKRNRFEPQSHLDEWNALWRASHIEIVTWSLFLYLNRLTIMSIETNKKHTHTT